MNGEAPSNLEVAFVVAAVRPDAAPNNSPFVMVLPGRESQKKLAAQLQDRYGPRGEKPSARKLTRENLGFDEATFALLDEDEDGLLDGEELSHFAQLPPDLEVRVRLGKKTGKEASTELVASSGHASPLAQAVRQGSDGTLVLESGPTRIELGRGGDPGDPQYARILRQQYLAQFQRADTDNNGYLDKNEARKSGFFGNLFQMIDRDGDGKLFEKEITAYLEKMKDLQEAAFRGCASLTVKDQGRGLFDMADADRDGRLSVREMRQMVKLVDQLDRDGDGQVGPREIPHKYRLDVKQGPANGNQFTPAVVAVSKIGIQAPEPPRRTAGPMWFRKMDRNRDGDVSRREFLGTEEEFRRIDTDGDGLLSVEEAERADKLFRQAKNAKP
jgi:Ca2+-binding EF-hand superfamily protein